MTTRAVSIAAAQILRHVAEGGWLGASWPVYVKGCAKLGGRQRAKAFALARLRANRAGWCLYTAAIENFNRDASRE